MKGTLLTAPKTFHIGMYLDICRPIWIRLSMMMDTIELDTLLLVCVIYCLAGVVVEASTLRMEDLRFRLHSEICLGWVTPMT